jgi:hypothetical protein
MSTERRRKSPLPRCPQCRATEGWVRAPDGRLRRCEHQELREDWATKLAAKEDS